ncbi:MAG: hypothetical protein CSA35_02595, partial [Dethiosulfovibrio peptidovorans]
MCENRCARRWAAAGTLVVFMTLLTSCAWAATILRVDATSVGGDGSSWAAALDEPQFRDALRAVTPASGEVEFWVKAGVYRPGSSNTDSFVLSNNVALYGGFAGGETTLGERDVSANVTVLTGDIDNNDANKVNGVTVSADNIVGTNSLRVVRSYRCDNTAILDGFTICAGSADINGAGMHNFVSNPLVRNCTFSGNKAHEAGGMCNNASSPTVTNCTFSGNKAHVAGGMRNWESCPTVTNCTFSGNEAEFGAGIFNNDNSCPALVNCTFSGNTAVQKGGGMRNYDSSNPTVTNCTFSGNGATWGGGMCNRNSDPIVTNCIFWDNVSGDFYNGGTSTPAVTYSVVEDISSPDIHVISSDPLLSPLADNGGPTWTMAIGEGSPARDAGTVSAD